MNVRNCCRIGISVFILLFSNLLFAWSANGHRIVAQIAWDQLKKDAETNPSGLGQNAINQIQPILDSLGTGTTLADISVCVDEIRLPNHNIGPKGVCAQFPIMTRSQPWHFIDIPTKDAPEGANDLEKYCLKDNCILNQND